MPRPQKWPQNHSASFSLSHIAIKNLHVENSDIQICVCVYAMYTHAYV